MEEQSSQKSTDLYNWVRMLAIGFSIVSFFISIAVIGYIWVTIKNQPGNSKAITPTIAMPSPTPTNH